MSCRRVPIGIRVEPFRPVGGDPYEPSGGRLQKSLPSDPNAPRPFDRPRWLVATLRRVAAGRTGWDSNMIQGALGTSWCLGTDLYAGPPRLIPRSRFVSSDRQTRSIGPAFELVDRSWAGEAQFKSRPTYLGPTSRGGSEPSRRGTTPEGSCALIEGREESFLSPVALPRRIMGLRWRLERVVVGPTTGVEAAIVGL